MRAKRRNRFYSFVMEVFILEQRAEPHLLRDDQRYKRGELNITFLSLLSPFSSLMHNRFVFDTL